MSTKKTIKYIKTISIIIVLILDMLLSTKQYSFAETTEEPTSEQKIEYRATKITKVNDTNQLKVEIWIHNLKFTGFDLRTQYDNTEITPSDPTTNDKLDLTAEDNFGEAAQNVVFTNGFDKLLEVMNVTENANEMRYVYSILPTTTLPTDSEYIKNDSEHGIYISCQGDVQIGYMTFAIDNIEANENDIELKSDLITPMTGVRLIVYGDASLNMQSETLFEFTVEAQTGTFEGSVDTSLLTKRTTGKNIATIRAYKMDDVNAKFNLTGIENNFAKKYKDDLHDLLLTLKPEKEIVSNDDGTFKLDLKPSSYLIMIDKPGYIDDMFKNVEIKTSKKVDVGKRTLIPGDINKDGCVTILDLSLLKKNNNATTKSTNYEERFDVNNDGKVNVKDISYVKAKNKKYRKIIDMTGLSNL